MPERKGGMGLPAVLVLVVLAVLAVLGGFYLGKRSVKPAPPAATRGPSFPAESIRTVSLERIKAYANSLKFDSVLGADSALVDFRQGLIGGKTARLARIEPESTSFRLTAQEAAQGRIIARIRSEDTIPSLGLGPAWTWWWVDSIGTGHWRSVLIPEHGKPPYHDLPDSLELEHHGDYHYKQALARFHVVSTETPHGDPFFAKSWSNACGGCCKQRLPVAPLH